MMVTAETLYDLEKNGQIRQFNKLTDHQQLQIYAGGGADYAVADEFLKHRRDDAKRFMAGICEGIGIARKDKAAALAFVAKTGRKLDAAGIEYLYRLYIKDVIPARPYLKPEGIDLAIQMNATLDPASRPINTKDLADSSLMPELVKRGSVRLLRQCTNPLALHLQTIHDAPHAADLARGMQRYRTDKEFSKKVLGKYGKINDEETLEGTWQDYAPTLQKTPRPSLKAIQFMIENQYPGKKPLPKPEQFVDLSIVEQLEKSGFLDALNK